MKRVLTWLGNNRFPVIILLSTILIITGMIYINEIIISIRLMELKVFIRDTDIKISKTDQLKMIGKFRLHKGLYENRIREDELQKREMDIMYLDLVSQSKKRSSIPLAANRAVAEPVIAVINAVRYIIGKPPLTYLSSDTEYPRLSFAYYLERIKQYAKAVDQYDEILRNNEVDRDEVYTLLLHQGFCLSLTGETEKARAKYLEIIKNYRDDDVAIIAAVLLRYLEEFEAEAEKVYASGVSPLEKSEQLYRLVAFDEALSILEQVGKAGKSAKVQYLEARCLEESGRQENAVMIYQQIIDTAVEKNNFGDETAKLANRRILTIAVTVDTKDKITELAEKNHQIIRDPEFNELLLIAEKTEKYSVKEEPVMEDGSGKDAGDGYGEDDTDDAGESSVDMEIESEQKTPDNNPDFDNFIISSIENIEKKITEKGITPAPLGEMTDTSFSETSGLNNDNTGTGDNAADDTLSGNTVTDASSEQKNREEPYQITYKNSKGNISRVEYYNQDNIIEKAKEFDDEGHVIKVMQYENGNLKVYFIYELDDKGNPVKIYAYDANGSMLEEKKDE